MCQNLTYYLLKQVLMATYKMCFSQTPQEKVKSFTPAVDSAKEAIQFQF